MSTCMMEDCAQPATKWISLALAFQNKLSGHTVRIECCGAHFEVLRLWALATGGTQS